MRPCCSSWAPCTFSTPSTDFLLGVGLVFLAGFVVLAKKYWFSIPYRGIVLATACYAGALLAWFV